MTNALKLNCPIKLNLTLFVTDKRPNGYHNLVSLFWKKNAPELLTITENYNRMSRDVLEVKNAVISGENLVTKSLKFAREKSPTLPYFDITLEKFFPTGSGIGAGSGNAAALLAFLQKNYNIDFSSEELSTLGADIPFLTQPDPLAMVMGIGEIVEPLLGDINLFPLLLFPDWQINTAEAYREIDEARDKKKVTTGFCIGKCIEVVILLQMRQHVGLLPNDFWHVALAHHSEYNLLAQEAEGTGALAYGLSGSGSCFFALYETFKAAKSAQDIFNKFKFIMKGQVL